MKKAMDGAHRAHPRRLDAAERRQGRGRARARGVPGAAGRREERVGPHHRGGPPAGGRSCVATGAAGCRPSSPPCASGRRPTSRRRRPGRRRPPSEVPTLAIGAAEVVVQRNLDRETQQQLVEHYINQVGGSNERDGRPRPTTRRRLRRGVVRGRPGRGQPRRGRGRAVPLRPGRRRPDELRDDAHRPAHPRRAGASRSSRTCSAGKATPVTTFARLDGGRHGRARDLPAIVDRLVAASAEAPKQGGRRGALGHPAHRRPGPGSPKPSSKATGKRSRSRSSSTRRSWAASSRPVGDTVIDGSVRRRLEQLENTL